jgi:hypothetical protein
MNTYKVLSVTGYDNCHVTIEQDVKASAAGFKYRVTVVSGEDVVWSDWFFTLEKARSAIDSLDLISTL